MRLLGKLFSPIDGMKNFITLSELLAVSPAHHSVTGFMLSKHLLHRICYFSNGAPRTRSINTIRRLLWEWDKEITGSGPTMCLAAGANSITLVSPVVLQLWTSDSSTNRTWESIFKKAWFCWCEKWLYIWQGNWDCCTAKHFSESSSLSWEIFNAQIALCCTWTQTQNVYQENKKEENTPK